MISPGVPGLALLMASQAWMIEKLHIAASISSWWAPIALTTAGFSPYFSASLPKQVHGLIWFPCRALYHTVEQPSVISFYIHAEFVGHYCTQIGKFAVVHQ